MPVLLTHYWSMSFTVFLLTIHILSAAIITRFYLVGLTYYNIFFISTSYSQLSLNYIVTNPNPGGDNENNTSHPYSRSDQSFNEWLSGVIDGDGHFLVEHGKYPRFILDQESKNLPILLIIQKTIGGIITKVNNKDAFRYTLNKRILIESLVHRINGNIRNSVRSKQFNRVCQLLEIPIIPAIVFTQNNAWMAGFFDTDGHISAGWIRKPAIQIAITNKHKVDMEFLIPIFNGNIYETKTMNPCHRWAVGSRSDVLEMVDYFTSSDLPT